MADNDEVVKDNSVYFIQPEILIGKTLPANSNFPNTRLQNIYSISFAKQIIRNDKPWAIFFNYPAVGISVSKTSFGNDDAIGNAYAVMPFIIINASRQLKRSVNFKIGMGASYFTAHFDKVDNPFNKAIGSAFTWTFHSGVDYTLLLKKHFSINLGMAFVHHSNGHTQLPNLGLNSFLFSISSKVFLSPLSDDQMGRFEKPELKKTKQYFYSIRSGIGMHEFGGEETAFAGLKKVVNIISVGGGIIYNQVFKLRVGFTYRFYNHYYSYITSYQPQIYVDRPVINSSNLFIFVGGELLLGHVGIDAELGINLFKPFYSEHSSMFEDDSEVSYWLKSTIVTRLGLKLYAISTAKSPKNNFFIGAHINANMGQADFSELSIGFIHVIKKSRHAKYPAFQ